MSQVSPALAEDEVFQGKDRNGTMVKVLQDQPGSQS